MSPTSLTEYLDHYEILDWLSEHEQAYEDAERYFRYHIKVVKNEKLTKPQKEWYYNYVKKLREEYGNNETN